jgi:hypothetical protein
MFIKFESDDKKTFTNIPVEDCTKATIRKRFGKSYFSYVYNVYGIDKNGISYSKSVPKDEYNTYMI